MKGTQIYFTKKRIGTIIPSCKLLHRDYGSGEETYNIVQEELEQGLGRAEEKIIRANKRAK